MARDASGTYTRVSNSFTVPVSGTTISPTDADAFWDELDTEITDSLSRSGKGGMSADLDMNNNDLNEIKTAVFQGSTSGNTTVAATAVAGTTTLTLPAATDTLVGKATTDELTNKTLDSAGTGNVLKLSGSTVTTASSVLDIVGSTRGQILFRGAASWSVLSAGGSNTYLQGSATDPSWVSAAQLAATLSAPQVTVLTSGSAQTYNTPANTKYLVVEIAGGGGGGAGSGTTPGAAGAGVASSFAGGAITLTANGGAAGTTAGDTIVAGGTATGGDFNFSGGVGGAAQAGANRPGGAGGQNVLFAGAGTVNVSLTAIAAGIVGNAAVANSGSGGSGASAGSTSGAGGGGGGGGSLRKLITSPNATFTYTVGGGGAAGTAGTGGSAGGAGAAGIIIVTAHFQ